MGVKEFFNSMFANPANLINELYTANKENEELRQRVNNLNEMIEEYQNPKGCYIGISYDGSYSSVFFADNVDIDDKNRYVFSLNSIRYRSRKIVGYLNSGKYPELIFIEGEEEKEN